MSPLGDLRQAGRQLAARPGFTLAAVIILAVGIGANAATFSIVNGLLLRPLPYPDSEAIVSVGQVPLGSPGEATLSTDELRRLWEEARSFEELAAFSPSGGFVWDGPDGPVTLFGAAVTPSLFPLLRTAPRLGRLFTEAEAVEGAHRVVLLSHRAWTSRFASDPAVIGAPIVLDDEPYTVLGVLPDGFESSFYGMEIWVPLVVPPYEPETPFDGSLVIMKEFTGFGRLLGGVSPAQAETEVRTILERAGPEGPRPPGFDFEDAGDVVAGGPGAPVPARAPDARRGDGTGAADGVRQRGRSAAGARDHAAAGAGRPGGARRGAGPDRPPTADRERRPGCRRRGGRPRRGGRDRARRTGADAAQRARARRCGCGWGRARVHRRRVVGRRPAVRHGAGARLVAGRSGAHPQRGGCVSRRLRPSPGEPGPGGIGGGAGGAGAGADDRRRVAAAQLRVAGHARSRLRAHQRRGRAHRRSFQYPACSPAAGGSGPTKSRR